MKNLKKLTALIMAVCMMAMLAACGGGDEKEEGAPAEGGEEKAEKLVIGTSADYAPFEFHKMKDGKDTILGSDIEMAKKIAEDMGRELEIKDVAFEVLLNELQNGSIDIVIAGMDANPERLEQADASDVYYDAQYQRLVIRAEDAEKYKTAEDLEGAKLGVQSGTIQMDIAKEVLAGCDMLVLQGVPDIFNNLINGKCEAALVDGKVGDGYIASNEGLTSIEMEFPTQEGFCVWVQKDDPKGLLESINGTLAEIASEGLYDQWLADADAQSESGK